MIIGSLLSISPEAFLFSIAGAVLIGAVVVGIASAVVDFVLDVLS